VDDRVLVVRIKLEVNGEESLNKREKMREKIRKKDEKKRRQSSRTPENDPFAIASLYPIEK
jgi:hypothetical protein